MEEHGQKYSTADHTQDNADGDFEGGDKHAPCHVANKNKHGPQPSRIKQDFLHGIPRKMLTILGTINPMKGR